LTERERFIELAGALWDDAQCAGLCVGYTLEGYIEAALAIYDNQEAKNATDV
jgi:hypothetical protein